MLTLCHDLNKDNGVLASLVVVLVAADVSSLIVAPTISMNGGRASITQYSTMTQLRYNRDPMQMKKQQVLK